MINIGKDIEVSPEMACKILWEDHFTHRQPEAIQAWDAFVAGGAPRHLIHGQISRSSELLAPETNPQLNLG